MKSLHNWFCMRQEIELWSKADLPVHKDGRTIELSKSKTITIMNINFLDPTLLHPLINFLRSSCSKIKDAELLLMRRGRTLLWTDLPITLLPHFVSTHLLILPGLLSATSPSSPNTSLPKRLQSTVTEIWKNFQAITGPRYWRRPCVRVILVVRALVEFLRIRCYSSCNRFFNLCCKYIGIHPENIKKGSQRCSQTPIVTTFSLLKLRRLVFCHISPSCFPAQ